MEPRIGRTPRRGDIWWADLEPVVGGEIGKRRPVAILSKDILVQRRQTVIIVPLSSLLRIAPPLTLPIHCMGKNGTAAVDHIRAIDKRRLLEFIEAMAPSELDAIRAALDDLI